MLDCLGTLPQELRGDNPQAGENILKEKVPHLKMLRNKRISK